MRFVTLMLLAIAVQASAGEALVPLANPLKPLYMAYAASTTDHFYTQDQNEYDYAQTIGFQGQGIVAYLEYTQIRGLDSNAMPYLTKPFHRFYHAQNTDHFYTSDEYEASLVVGWGWVYEGVEGYIYDIQVPGTVPLHRLNKTNQMTQDHDHFYTASEAERIAKINQGWEYDRIAGYVYTTPTPSVPNGLAMGFRTGITPNYTHCNMNPVEGCYSRSQLFGDLFTTQTGYSPGKRVQWVSFDITSYGLATSGDHFGIMLRSALDTQARTKDGFYYWGMGLAMGELDGDYNSCEAFPENFRTGQLFGSGTDFPWNDGVTYNVYVSIDNNRRLNYQLYQNNQLVAWKNQVMDTVTWHPESTGLFITGAGIAHADWTAYITNLRYGWY